MPERLAGEKMPRRTVPSERISLVSVATTSGLRREVVTTRGCHLSLRKEEKQENEREKRRGERGRQQRRERNDETHSMIRRCIETLKT